MAGRSCSEEVRGYREALQCYHLGYEVGRLVSLERLIEQNKERYYETLGSSPKRWHEQPQ